MQATINVDVQMPVAGLADGVEQQLLAWLAEPLHADQREAPMSELRRAATQLARARVGEFNAMSARDRAKQFPGVGHVILTGVALGDFETI